MDRIITLSALKLLLHRRVQAAGGIRPFARLARVNASHVCVALKPGERPIPSIVAALGYEPLPPKFRRLDSVSDS